MTREEWERQKKPLNRGENIIFFVWFILQPLSALMKRSRLRNALKNGGEWKDDLINKHNPKWDELTPP